MPPLLRRKGAPASVRESVNQEHHFGLTDPKFNLVAAGLTFALFMSPVVAFAADGADAPTSPSVLTASTEVKTTNVDLNLNETTSEDSFWKDRLAPKLVSVNDKTEYSFAFVGSTAYRVTNVPYGTYTLEYATPEGYTTAPEHPLSGSQVEINQANQKIYVTLIRTDAKPGPVLPVQDNPQEPAKAKAVEIVVHFDSSLASEEQLKNLGLTLTDAAGNKYDATIEQCSMLINICRLCLKTFLRASTQLSTRLRKGMSSPQSLLLVLADHL